MIPGDGIGPEISAAVVKIFEAANVRIVKSLKQLTRISRGEVNCRSHFGKRPPKGSLFLTSVKKIPYIQGVPEKH